jgi:hypothetical protein
MGERRPDHSGIILCYILCMPVQYYMPMDFGLNNLKERYGALVSSSITPQISRKRALQHTGSVSTYGGHRAHCFHRNSPPAGMHCSVPVDWCIDKLERRGTGNRKKNKLTTVYFLGHESLDIESTVSEASRPRSSVSRLMTWR